MAIKPICGDAVEAMKKLPDGSIHLIVTDPPYNLCKDYGNNKDSLDLDEYLEFSRRWLAEANRVLTDNEQSMSLWECAIFRIFTRFSNRNWA